MKKKILIIVDMQNDFIFPEYALGTKEAVVAFNNLKNKLSNLDTENTIVIVTKDTHSNNYLSTQEGKKLPIPHCMTGTEGHRMPEELLEILEEFTYAEYEKNTFGSLALMNNFLMDDSIEWNSEIEICGLCTDICVVSNALLVKACLPNASITVDSSCCAGSTPEAHEAALKVMQSCHIDII